MQIQIISDREELQELFNEMLKDAVKSLPKDVVQEPTIVTGDELCQKLSITIQTLIRWKAKNKVPYFQIGSSIRYDLNKVLEALEVGKRKR